MPRNISAFRRRQVYEQTDYRCAGCGLQFEQVDGRPKWIPGTNKRGRDTLIGLEVDHILPVIHGGSDALINLQALCTPCNNRKGAKL